jgi:hypothetical protein
MHLRRGPAPSEREWMTKRLLQRYVHEAGTKKVDSGEEVDAFVALRLQ